MQSTWAKRLVSLLAASSMALPAPGLTAVEIIAHRGASYDAPENTLSAMRLAWEQGADAIELDLWLSRDGRLVVFHDADTKRFGGSARKVSEQTWAELQQLDVGGWKDLRFKGERIPTLESILATVPVGRRAVLEIKCGPEILDALEQALQAAGGRPEQLAIISFSYETLRRAKQRFPQIPHYLLHDYKKRPDTGQYPELGPLLAQAKAGGFQGLNLHFDWPITEAFAAAVKTQGLKLLVWTVDDPAVARRLVKAGVDGLTTNRPGWLRAQLQSSSSLARERQPE
jgi:glycerophosphoryl diester phosphodiesterase